MRANLFAIIIIIIIFRGGVLSCLFLLVGYTVPDTDRTGNNP